MALLVHLVQLKEAGLLKGSLYTVTIDTGWAALQWVERVAQAKALCQRLGVEWIFLDSVNTFSELVLERKAFPSRKFQWCAASLKGIPFLAWLDEQDPACTWTVCLPKRQSMMRRPLEESIESCDFHGERRVWHPLWKHEDAAVKKLRETVGFPAHKGRSLECDPCVNSTSSDVLSMMAMDIEKTTRLENQLQQPFLLPDSMGRESLASLRKRLQIRHDEKEGFIYDQFGLGCGDPFGCGL